MSTEHKGHKTNATRILDGLGIAYEIREYEVSPEEFSAVMVAEKIGLPPEQVFKTLLCATSDKEHVFAVVPGDAELDFKKLAAAAGARRAEMVSLKDVQPLTGYVRGGVTVFGAKKDFPVYVDETLELFDVVSVSAGTRGVQVLLKPEDYLQASKATVADLTRENAGPRSTQSQGDLAQGKLSTARTEMARFAQDEMEKGR